MLTGTPVTLDETPFEKSKRIRGLEADFENWAKYYFPKYYEAAPAPFHIRASRRIISKAEWFEVRSWSRGMAKSVRSVMEILYLTLTGKKHNILIVSHTLDHATELANPFRTELENNNRIINDYGLQRSLSKWKEDRFKTQKGVQFRALGKGQNPRGTRNENYRPDIILIDDIDSDEEVRNLQRIKDGLDWIEQALLSTRSSSTSEKPLLILVCGNIIGQYCSVSELGKKADRHDIVNIMDKNEQSNWKGYISKRDIERIRATISERAFQQEYMNNPMPQGDVFTEVKFDSVPKLSTCQSVIIYADPATSNRDVAGGSMKAIGIIAKKKSIFYLYKVWLNNMNNDTFIDILFEAHRIVKEDEGVDITKVFVENNSLQNPFYEQVLLPLIRKKAQTKGHLPITPDTRKKADKYARIEATLEPLNRLKQLILNKKEEGDTDMQRLRDQLFGVAPKAKIMDGPDMLEGGVWILQKKHLANQHQYYTPQRHNRKF
ncbi:hypothetical protein ElyMa_002417100 [Elysia marginata]|uniref:Terminase large subunit gp17-like C-terminal domain-containing protein n=1 Tax=Elysia marginata TaxID=1093978 RepID=A0AAV4GFB4_9GAST|nr:hypothetical protein ElyMa_002417100 [Elysia marginata]